VEKELEWGKGRRRGQFLFLKAGRGGRCSHDAEHGRRGDGFGLDQERRLKVGEGRRHVGPARQRQREGATVAHADWADPARKKGGGEGKARRPSGNGPTGRK
jgi:hypothetical protein